MRNSRFEKRVSALALRRCSRRRPRPLRDDSGMMGCIRQLRVGREDFGWPGRVRSTGRVAKRQEAAPYGSNWPETFRFAECASVPVPVQLVADEAASCRFATWRPGHPTARSEQLDHTQLTNAPQTMIGLGAAIIPGNSLGSRTRQSSGDCQLPEFWRIQLPPRFLATPIDYYRR